MADRGKTQALFIDKLVWFRSKVDSRCTARNGLKRQSQEKVHPRDRAWTVHLVIYFVWKEKWPDVRIHTEWKVGVMEHGGTREWAGCVKIFVSHANAHQRESTMEEPLMPSRQDGLVFWHQPASAIGHPGANTVYTLRKVHYQKNEGYAWAQQTV